MKHILVSAVIIFFTALSAHTQNKTTDIKTVFEKVKQVYASEDAYAFNVKYELFRNDSIQKAEEFYTGKVVKNEDKYYSKIKNTEFIKLEDAYLKINHDEKAMLYSKEDAKLNTNQLTDLSTFLSLFENTHVAIKNDNYICTLTSKNISVLPYSKVIIYINTKDFTITKQVLHITKQSFFKDSKGKQIATNPRLEMTFSNFNTKSINVDHIFSLSKYVSIAGNKIKASNNLKAYQLIDASEY